MNDSSLLYNRIGSIAQVTFNRPDVLNAFKMTMFDDLLTIIDEVRNDDTLRVLVLTGSGTAFSAGIDLAEQSHLFAEQIDTG